MFDQSIFESLEQQSFTGSLNSNDQRHGQALVKYLCGSTLTGTYKDGRLHGFCTLKLKDGSVFTGMFHNGVVHGSGKYVGGDGQSAEGDWIDGKLTGRAEIIDFMGVKQNVKYQNGVLI